MFGADVVRVVMADGCERLLPVGWTSLHGPSRADLGEISGRLALEPLRELARWVAARPGVSNHDRRKVGHFDKWGDNVGLDGEVPSGALGREHDDLEHDAADERSERGAAAAVVEQAGSSRSGRRSGRGHHRKQRKRGVS